MRYDAGMAYGQNRIGAVHRGEIDAIFDEGASTWGNMALELGMTFLSLDETILQSLEKVGLRRGLIEKSNFPKLDKPTCRPSISAAGRSTRSRTRRLVGARFLPALGRKQS